MWEALLTNLAYITTIAVIWQLVADKVKTTGHHVEMAVIGLILGIAGVVSITSAVEVSPGVLFDLRAALMAAAAFFGGPIGATIAVAITGGFRIYVGGVGVAPGLASILATTCVGLSLRWFLGGQGIGIKHIAWLTLGSGCAYYLGYLLLPPPMILEILKETALPAGVLNILTTFCLASLLLRELRRRELVHENATYRQMVELLPDPLNVKDPEGRFVTANPATAALMGCDAPSALIGKTDRDFYTEADAARFADIERVVLETRKTLSAEQKIEIDDQPPIWVASKKVPMFDTSGRAIGVITHNRDVTQHHKLLEMKSQFVSLVSHELRTPLTSVRGALSLLSRSLDGANIPDTTRNLLQIAQRNSERLVHLINDILDVEKIEADGLAFDIAPHEIAPLVTDALPTFEQYLPNQKVGIRFVNNAPDVAAAIDPRRFEQVLSNFVSNAIKFSRAESVVTIGLDLVGESLVLSVRDDGEGIPEAFRERIFERFSQAETSDARSKGGTGLGLHIAKVFVQKMGGQVSFTSIEGQGTTFYITLPALTAAQPGKPASIEDAPSLLQTPPLARVLYVEDDTSLGSILKALLMRDAHVDCVATLAEASAAIERTAYDALVIDDDLPDGSGLDLVFDEKNNTPSIIFTARELHLPADARIVCRFVKTRVEEREVVDAVRAILHDRQAA